MSDLTTTQIFATGEKNITATKMNNIIGGAVIQPDFYASKPTASSVNPTDNLLILSGGAYAQAPFSTVVNSVGASMGPQITAVRLRSFNAIGNPTFEVDQVNVGNTVSNVGNVKIIDRWKTAKTGTMQLSAGRNAAAAGEVLIPGMNFFISSYFFRVTLTTQQASLGATDNFQCFQSIEGSRLRELFGDVHSSQLLVRSSVAGLKFGLCLQDQTSSKSLVKLCTIPSANTWTLITLPNLPIFASGGTWGGTPGIIGYYLMLTLAAGTTLTAPANDTWQNGNFVGAVGQDNFASKPVNSTFDIAFVQHEPGAQCTTPIDCSWQQNYDDCLRYFAKSYDYEIAPGTATFVGGASGWQSSTTFVSCSVRFPKAMAKIPTVIAYNPVGGTANSLRLFGVSYAVSSVSDLGKGGFDGLTAATMPAVVAGQTANFHYTSDTGW
jgi:hypothetical protein